MRVSRYSYTLIFILVLAILSVEAQVPKKRFVKKDFESEKFSKFETDKKIPKEIRLQILTALSFYPELSATNVHFRFRKRKSPLTSRPRFFSVFKKPKNRSYVITLSTRTNKKFTPILFNNLPYNSQIGVIGHELAHITEYKTMNTGKLLGLIFNMLNPKYVDKFEYNTDFIAINHGLAHQLLDWSSYVRTALEIKYWRGVSDNDAKEQRPIERQRYMNPETIKSHILSNNIYMQKVPM